MIYCDQAATSYPKPPAVIEAVTRMLTETSASPGRSGHQFALTASRTVFDARENVAELLGEDDSARIVFALNVTMALNMALSGYLKPGDHVLTSSMEHNSVMRPLNDLARTRGIEVETIQADPAGTVDPGDFIKRIKKETRLAVVNHVSNVTGAIAPLSDIKEGLGEVPLLVDVAQSAGVMPLSPCADLADMMAFTGHKSLLGPTGTGGLWMKTGFDLKPLVTGGTGSRSEHEIHPDFMPDALEAGTPNTHGLAGLAAGIGFILDTGLEKIRQHEIRLTGIFLDALSQMKGITVYGPPDPASRTAVVSINLEQWSPSDLALTLDREYGIMTRPGLHCAPSAHRTIGTFPQGTVRFSFGWYNTEEEIRQVIRALDHLNRKTSH